MKKRSDGTFLLHIFEALNDIVSYTADGQAEFFAEKMRQDAVERKFEIIGEAVKNLSQGFRDKYPDVDWSYMAKYRDLLSHHYFGIDQQTVWSIARNDAKDAYEAISKLEEYVKALDDFRRKQHEKLEELRRKKDEIYSIARKHKVNIGGGNTRCSYRVSKG